MGKKKYLNNRLVGMIATKIATTSVIRDISLEDSFDEYMNDLSKAMEKYDITDRKDDIFESAFEKLPEDAQQKHKIDQIGSVQMPTPQPKTSSGVKRRFVDPEMVKVKGEVAIVNSKEGIFVQKTEATKKVKVKCPPESKPVIFGDDDDRAGCEIP